MCNDRRPAVDALEPLERRQMLAAAVGGWTALSAVPKAKGLTSDLSLDAYKPYSLSTKSIATSLALAPVENVAKYGVGRGAGSRLINVPTPEGGFARFRIVESAIQGAADAKKFSNIKTYAGVGVDDPAARIRLDLTPLGFHAQVLTPTGDGAYYVDPYFRQNNGTYVSYYGDDANGRIGAAPADDIVDLGLAAARGVTGQRTSAGTTGTAVSLRTYKLAVAATGEYTAAVGGGTVTGGQAAIVTAINRVTGIYETELAIRLTLVSNNSLLVYTNASTDPYTNTSPNTLLTENQANINAVVGNANYDIGHVFSTGGGGLAGLGVVGISTRKAQGETGLPNPTGDAFYVDYVAHEMGHQFGGNHTFNTANDTGNRNANTAYEPGSGTTIMAYAGLEGTDDLQPNSQQFFAWKSLDEILTHVDTVIPAVGTRVATGNTIPTVAGPGNFTIPSNTPFALTATGSDPNGDTVYYSWEEADLGAAINLNTADNAASPLFRVYDPTTNPTRTFPQLASVLNGNNYTAAPAGSPYLAERLPTTSRTMKFVITARDRRAGAGGTNVISGTTTNVTSVLAASTFAVSSFNTATSFSGGSTQTVTWNVAGTTGNGINTANVNILMSTDGGLTFPTTLASGTANDGSEAITLPNVASTAVRFKVAAVGNIYFDINNANASITAVTPSTIDSVTIDDGTAQRSRVRSATVLFNGTIPAANIAAGAFTLTQTSGTIAAYGTTVAGVTTPAAGKTAVTINFTGASVVAGSVADGRYSLSIDGSKITNAAGVKVDAFGNGVAGSVRSVLFHRFYGDVTGEATVDISDFNVFAPAFGLNAGQTGYVDAFDFNGDSMISIIDFNEFAPRFGLSL